MQFTRSTAFSLPDALRRVLPLRLKRALASWLYRYHFERRFTFEGGLRSTARIDQRSKHRANAYFHHRQSAETTFSAANSWYGGDYFEFGCCGLVTFRNMLSAFDICELPARFPDTRFYGFDVFGKLETPNPDLRRTMREFDARTRYFSDQFPTGDAYREHMDDLRQHGLFVSQCRLVQGFFQDTLTPQFSAEYKAEGRSIGFAFIDCNFEEQYKVVFEFIFDLMAPHSYIYMDEYFQASGVTMYFSEFAERLLRERGIACVFVRSAGAFGGLFRLYPVRSMPPLDLPGGTRKR